MMIRNRLKFQRKLMAVFVGMTLLPTVALVLVSYQLISRSIERWANHEIGLTLENSAAILGDAKELAYTLELHENKALADKAEYLAVDFDLVDALDAADVEAVKMRAAELADANEGYLIAVYDRFGHKVFSSHPDLPPVDLTEFLDFLHPSDQLPDGLTISHELEDQGFLICGVQIFSHETTALTEKAEYLAVDFDLVDALDAADAEAVKIRAAELTDANEGYLIAVYDRFGHKVFSSRRDLPPVNLTDFLHPLDQLPDAPISSQGLASQGLLVYGIPIFSEDGGQRLGAVVVGGQRWGAVVIGKSMPLTPTQMREEMESIEGKLGAIKNKLGVLETNIDEEGAAYRRTEKRTTFIALVITAVLIVAISFWVSQILARGINTPIRSLVTGTEQIADGNLDYRVEVQTDDEFAVLANSFNQMVDDLKERTEELRRAEKIAAWQDIAQKLAHEIKNPLTPIQLSAQRLQRRYHNNREGFAELLDRCTQTIIAEVEGLRRLLDEFSLLARMPALQLSSINLHETIDATLDLFGELPPHIDCKIDVSPDLPPIIADAEHLKRAFFNLIKNALEATSEISEGTLAIRAFASADSSKVFVQFSDTGTGIPPEVRPKLFTPHVSTKKEGTGLGLAIVKKILTDLGGDIRLGDPVPNKTGTTFTLWLKTA